MNGTDLVLRKSLVYGSVLALVVGVIGAVIGVLTAGTNGLVSALVGAAMTAVFLGMTAASVLVARRITRNDPASPVFFAVVMGVWFLKMVLFLVVAIALRGQPWLNPYVYFGVVLVAVVGSLVADAVAMQRTRVPYVDVELPGAPSESQDEGS